MAFGCEYTAHLIITHASMKAEEISRKLSTLTPYKTATVGDYLRTLSSGKHRFAYNTVWAANLLEQATLHGDTLSVDDCLRAQIPRLEVYHDVFREINEHGQVRLELHLMMDTPHTAFEVYPHVLRSLGECQVSLDVEVSYSRRE